MQLAYSSQSDRGKQHEEIIAMCLNDNLVKEKYTMEKTGERVRRGEECLCSSITKSHSGTCSDWLILTLNVLTVSSVIDTDGKKQYGVSYSDSLSHSSLI